jgi:hypothetical protein
MQDMTQPTNRILKSGEFDVEGHLTLDLGHYAQSGQNNKNIATGSAKVRILENQSEYAIIEVTCCCGRKTVIRCDYSGRHGLAARENVPQPQPAGNVKPGTEKK